jgi:ribonuclease J
MTKPKTNKAINPNDKSLKVTALGGLHEIGKNMFVFECEDEMIIVDSGVYFPGHDSPGIDYTMADYNYLIKRSDKVKALFVTSVDDFHIGGAHHVITKLNIKKIYGSKLALELLKVKLGSANAQKREWYDYTSRQTIKESPFEVTPIFMTSNSHANYSLHIKANGSSVFYSGSFKIDQTPIDNVKTDIVGITEIGCEARERGEGVDLYLGDSVNVEQEGYSKSERILINRFEEILANTPGRIIFNTYTENTIRIQNLLRVADRIGRKVALLNKETKDIIEALLNAGILDPKRKFVNLQDIQEMKDTEVLILSSASEGEAIKELETIAYDKHPQFLLKEGDTVVNSGDLPPGTVRVMAQISDALYLKKVNIIGGRNANIHVESHAMTEELKFIFNILRPKYFIPMVGETRHLVKHAKLAVDTGFDPGSIFILDNGDQIKLLDGNLEVSGQINTGEILFSDSQDFQVDNKIIKERDALAQDGVVTVAFTMNKKNKVVSGPVFSAKACTFSSNKEWRAFCLMNSQDIVDEIENLSSDNPKAGIEDYQDLVREKMNRMIKTQIGKRPSVVVLANLVSLGAN